MPGYELFCTKVEVHELPRPSSIPVPLWQHYMSKYLENKSHPDISTVVVEASYSKGHVNLCATSKCVNVNRDYSAPFLRILTSPIYRSANKISQSVSKLTHTGVDIGTCAFHSDCQLSSAASGMSLGWLFFFYTISVAWSKRAGQLAAGGVAPVRRREFDPRRVDDDLSVPLWVYIRVQDGTMAIMTVVHQPNVATFTK